MGAWLPPLSACPGAHGTFRFGIPRVLDRAGSTYPLKRAIPSARGRVTSPSPLRSRRRLRNLERISIGSAVRLPLRARLTLIRLALIRNPWPSGVGVCAPIIVTYAYICFSRSSTDTRVSDSTPRECSPTATAFRCGPCLRYRTYARLLSMRPRSTSELLRTL